MVTISKISGYRSRVINTIIDALTRQRPVPGPGLLATQGPGGTVLYLARSSGVDGGGGGGELLPWTANIYQDEDDAWRIKFVRCGYVRGPVTRIIDPDPDFELPAPPDSGSGIYWIGVKIDTETGLVAPPILCSKSASDVFDVTPPEDEFFRRLLCTITYTEAEEETPASWAIKDGWYRLLPELGAYV